MPGLAQLKKTKFYDKIDTCDSVTLDLIDKGATLDWSRNARVGVQNQFLGGWRQRKEQCEWRQDGPTFSTEILFMF